MKNDIKKYRWFNSINLNLLQEEIYAENPLICYSSVYKRGNTLVVKAEKSTFFSGGINQDKTQLLAECDGEILSLSVLRGYPLKKVGDKVKTEMEDLSLKFLDYTTYKYIAHALNEKKSERDAYIQEFIRPLQEKLSNAGFQFTIKGRPKSIHSIYHKMQAQRCDVDRICDLFAIRIILDSELEREKFKYLHPYTSGGQAGRM